MERNFTKVISFCNFVRSFPGFFKVFASSLKFSHMFGPAWTHLDPSGPVQKHSDTSRCIRMPLEAFDRFEKISENLKEFQKVR